MKLDRTGLQRQPVEEDREWQLALPAGGPVAVLVLHGQLPSLAWAFAQAAPGARLGYVQSAGSSPAGGGSEEVRALRARGLLAGDLTAGAARGDAGEALTTAGALHHGLGALGWDAVVCGPGPAALGDPAQSTNGGFAALDSAQAAQGGFAALDSAQAAQGGFAALDSAQAAQGGFAALDSAQAAHGGFAALDSAHAALALGCRTLLVARMSSAEPRTRRRGVCPDTLAVLDLLLQPVTVALPAGLRSPVGADLRAGLGAVFGVSRPAPAQLELDVARPVRVARHDWRRAPVDLPAFAASGLPARAGGRGPAEDPLFFAAALAAGAALAQLLAECQARRPAEHHEYEYHEDGEGAAA